MIDITKRSSFKIKINKKTKTNSKVKCYNETLKTLGEIILIKKIGTKSVDGDVYRACYPLNCKNMIAVKRIKIDIDKDNEKYAENFLTKQAVNSSSSLWSELMFLYISTQMVKQRLCPNLPMYFDYNFCNNCDLTTQKSCLYISNELADGDLKTYLLTGDYNFDELLSCYMQIFLGLYTLKYHFGIQHNDLHYGNVLFHTLKHKGDKKMTLWRYKFKDNTYIDVPIFDKLFVIWDFGRSTIFNKVEPRAEWYLDYPQSFEKEDLFKDYVRITSMLKVSESYTESDKEDSRNLTKQNLYDRNFLYSILKGIIKYSGKYDDIKLILKLLPIYKSNRKIEETYELEKNLKINNKFVNSLKKK